MCWNAEVSLQTFITGSIILLLLNLVGIELFVTALIFCILFIQLVEYFIWTYIKDKETVKYFTILTYLIIFFQPIILLSFLKYKYKIQLISLYIILHIIILLIFRIFFNMKYDFAPIIADNGHLNWNWTQNKEYMSFFYLIYNIAFLGAMFLYGNPIILLLSIVTLLYSMYNYTKYNTIASMWCYVGNIALFIFAIIHIWKKRKQIIKFLLKNNKKMKLPL